MSFNMLLVKVLGPFLIFFALDYWNQSKILGYLRQNHSDLWKKLGEMKAPIQPSLVKSLRFTGFLWSTETRASDKLRTLCVRSRVVQVIFLAWFIIMVALVATSLGS